MTLQIFFNNFLLKFKGELLLYYKICKNFKKNLHKYYRNRNNKLFIYK